MKTILMNFDNVGGLSHMYLVAASGLVRIEQNISDGKIRPIIASGTTVYNIGVLSSDNFSFNERMSLADGGNVFDVEIHGYIPRMDNMVDVLQLEEGEWIVIHQDANGTILMSGSKDVPLRLISDKSSGTSVTKNATSFTIQGQEPRASYEVSEELLVL